MSTLKRKRGRPRKAEVRPIDTPSEKKKIQAELVIGKIVENPALSVGNAARQLGLPEHIAHNPQTLTRSAEWSEMLDKFLSNDALLETHQKLLKASRIDNLIFPRDGEPSDEEIALMLEEVGCTLRKIVHGDLQRRAYFFAPDNRARKDALDLAYKLRGSYAVDKAAVAFSLVQLASFRATQLKAGEPIAELPAPDAPSMPTAA